MVGLLRTRLFILVCIMFKFTLGNSITRLHVQILMSEEITFPSLPFVSLTTKVAQEIWKFQTSER